MRFLSLFNLDFQGRRLVVIFVLLLSGGKSPQEDFGVEALWPSFYIEWMFRGRTFMAV